MDMKKLLGWGLVFVVALGLGYWSTKRGANLKPSKVTACGLLATHNQRHPFAQTDKTNRLQDGAIFETTAAVMSLLAPLAPNLKWKVVIGKPRLANKIPLGSEPGVYLRRGQPRGFNKAPSCGQAVNFYLFDRTKILMPLGRGSCPDLELVLLHESIHALGFAGHVTDEGQKTIFHERDTHWPRLKDWEKPKIDSPLKEAIRLLYAAPPGTDFSEVCPANPYH